jgi:hypothetical protein
MASIKTFWWLAPYLKEPAKEEPMPSSLATVFRKRTSCPSSQTLVAFRRSHLSYEGAARIETHLATCDFCNAELQLLTFHYSDPEEYAFAEMPAPLRSLAESLLRASASFKGLVKFQEYYQT